MTELNSQWTTRQQRLSRTQKRVLDYFVANPTLVIGSVELMRLVGYTDLGRSKRVTFVRALRKLHALSVERKGNQVLVCRKLKIQPLSLSDRLGPEGDSS